MNTPHPQTAPTHAPTDMASLAGKYMTFRLGAEEYGVAILKVRELIGLLEITRVPHAPVAVKGVVNLRGRVIPVVALRAKMGMDVDAPVPRPVIIVVQLPHGNGSITTGVMVDQVLDVRDIKAQHIEPPPTFGPSDEATQYILGVGKTDKRVVLLIDLERLLSAAEVAPHVGPLHHSLS